MTLNFENAQEQHARLLSTLLACDNPESQRARELRGMMRELERDMRTLEQRRVYEMAARLHLPDGAGAE